MKKTLRQAEALEEEIWALLGLGGQPHKRGRKPTDSPALEGMLRLYQEMRNEDDELQHPSDKFVVFPTYLTFSFNRTSRGSSSLVALQTDSETF